MLSVNFHTKVKAKQGRNSNNLILNHMREAARDTTKAYDIILLTQLRNGSYIGGGDFLLIPFFCGMVFFIFLGAE